MSRLPDLGCPPADVLHQLRANVADARSVWIDLWRDLVDIDSGPGELAGIHRVYDRLEPVLGTLGLDARREPTGEGPDVLVGRDPAGGDDRCRVLFIGHVDTVFPAPAARERPFVIAGGRATGPGVADMKGGVVLALAAIAALPAPVRTRLEVTVLVNGDEESASVASRPVIERYAGQTEVALVFESGRPNGNIVVARRGAVRLELDVVGVAAHSGVDPGAGANAAEQAAHHVLALQDFGRRTAGVSLTVTTVTAGHLPNIVPDSARIHLDGRFDTDTGATAIREFVADVASRVDVAGTTTRCRVLNERPAFPSDSAHDALADCYVTIAAGLGVPAGTLTTGGSSDGNFAAALGVPTLDGLGPIGGEYHTSDEWSDVGSLVDRAAVAAGLLTALSCCRSTRGDGEVQTVHPSDGE